MMIKNKLLPVPVLSLSIILFYHYFCNIQNVDGHGYLFEPSSRNYEARKAGIDYDPIVYNAGGIATVKENTPGDGTWPYPETSEMASRHGVCGNPSMEKPQKYNGAVSDYPIVATYQVGQTIEIEVIVTAHHKGHFEFYLCNPGNDLDQSLTQECFMKNPLKRIAQSTDQGPKDSNYPTRVYVSPTCSTEQNTNALITGYSITSTFKLPDDIECDHCVLQWYWVTGNSCNAPGYREYDYPEDACDVWYKPGLPDCGGDYYPEEWWNCADISITSDGKPVPGMENPSTPDSSGSASTDSSGGSGSSTGGSDSTDGSCECYSIAAQISDQWCKEVECDPIYSDYCSNVYCDAYNGSYDDSEETEEVDSGSSSSDSSSTTTDGGGDGGSSGGGGTGACISINPQASDEWCAPAGMCDAYPTYCAYDTGGSGVSSGSGGDSNNPATTPATPSPVNSPPVSVETPGSSPSPPSVIENDIEAGPCSKVNIAYYTAWSTYDRNYFPRDIKLEYVTHLNYAFANVDPDGSVVLGDKFADVEKTYPGMVWDDPIRGNLGEFIKLKKIYPHLKLLISIGGWTWSKEFSQMAKSSTKMQRFANTAVKFMLDYDLDGIDIDWEYPVAGGLGPWDPVDKVNFTKLLKMVRNKLEAVEANKYLLTIATSASSVYANNMENAEIAKYITYMNIMTYDFNGPWSGATAHNAPLFANSDDGDNTWNSDNAVNTYNQLGLPRDQIVFGLPMYGRSFANAKSGSSDTGLFSNFKDAGPGSWENGILDYDDIMENYIAQPGWKRYWDQQSRVPYLFNEAKEVFISYDDIESISEKARYINAMGLAGGMWWDLSSDKNGELLQTAWAILKKNEDSCLRRRGEIIDIDTVAASSTEEINVVIGKVGKSTERVVGVKHKLRGDLK